MKKGKEYELLIERIYKELQGDAEIKQDDFILGKESGTKRQLDLTIRHKIAETEILIIVQAKDWKHKADITIVGEFISVIRDVRGQKGILICKSGFTKKAIEYAKRENIQLLSAHAAEKTDWKLELNIPVLRFEKIFKTQYTYEFQFTTGENQTSAHIDFNFATFKIGEIILQSHEFINFLLKGIKLDSSGKRRKLIFPLKDIFCQTIDKKWTLMNQIEIEYYFEKHVISKNNFSPSEYRVLRDYSKEHDIHSFLKWDDIIPLLQSKSSWKDVTKNKEAQIIKNPYIIVKGISFGIFYSCSYTYLK